MRLSVRKGNECAKIHEQKKARQLSVFNGNYLGDMKIEDAVRAEGMSAFFTGCKNDQPKPSTNWDCKQQGMHLLFRLNSAKSILGMFDRRSE